MNSDETDVAHDAPIKPVSLLKSHFEKIAARENHSNTPVNRSHHGAKQQHRLSSSHGQSSPPVSEVAPTPQVHENFHRELDKPRLYQKPQKPATKFPKPPVARVSTVMQRAPSITVESPFPSHVNGPQPASVSASHGEDPSLPSLGDVYNGAGTWDGVTNGPGPPRSSGQSARRCALQDHIPTTSPHSPNEAVRPAPGSTMPPPVVNRADKPILTLSPSARGSKDPLRPPAPCADDRVSPFSTPPSSDESDMVDRCSNTTKPPQARIGPNPGRTAHSIRPGGVPHDSPLEIKHSKLNKADQRSKPSLPLRKQMGRQEYGSEVHRNARTAYTSQATLSHRPTDAPRLKEPTFLPPPKRIAMTSPPKLPVRDNARKQESNLQGKQMDPVGPTGETRASASLEFPDPSRLNRRYPYFSTGPRAIHVGRDARLFDACGTYVCAIGHFAEVWDVATGDSVFNLGQYDRDVRYTAIAFKPSHKSADEGSRVWLGTSHGDLQEVDILSRSITSTRTGPHERREIVRIHRHQNTMWTIDDGGKLCTWLGQTDGLPSLQGTPNVHRVQKNHTCSLTIVDTLWLASGKEIWIYRPGACVEEEFTILQKPLSQPHIGLITSSTIVNNQMDRVYFGHTDGKISVYSVNTYNCLAIIDSNGYKINSLAGAGSLLWAALSIGMIYVFDTSTRPWMVMKGWPAHDNSPVLALVADRSSLWKEGNLRLLSLGADHNIRFWDGALKEDWLERELCAHDVEYCTFADVSAFVMTWNAGAATPGQLRHDHSNLSFLADLLSAKEVPDLLIFGFQELVDLEDKKLTARTLLKGGRKKESAEQEDMSRQYRTWRDYLVRYVDEHTLSREPYRLLHTANLVGLFSCVLVKASQQGRVRNVASGEVKRGMGGLHGNKGALLIRFLVDDTSVCLANCHLAAGQTQTSNRNNDISAILESEVLPPDSNATSRLDNFTCGGDGSMVFDHELCIVNGDLNYRIDTMGRDTIIKAIASDKLPKLLERDQLLLSQRRNQINGVRRLHEAPITFAPTYKYDVGSDQYDTSEKRRAPAWCDRILYQGSGKIKQTDYRRHELRVSDHRPVTGLFKMRVKSVSPLKRAQVWSSCEDGLRGLMRLLADDSRVAYLRDVLGVPYEEARTLVQN